MASCIDILTLLDPLAGDGACRIYGPGQFRSFLENLFAALPAISPEVASLPSPNTFDLQIATAPLRDLFGNALRCKGRAPLQLSLVSSVSEV